MDLNKLPQLAIDVALIDGPPGNRAIDVPRGAAFTGGVARNLPLKWVLCHLNGGGTVFVDDEKRPAETLFVSNAIDEYPTLISEMIYTEKGLAKLTLPVKERKNIGTQILAIKPNYASTTQSAACLGHRACLQPRRTARRLSKVD